MTTSETNGSSSMNSCGRVLIVDDELVVLSSVKRVLQYVGMSLDCAEDVASARLMMQKCRYEAFVLDIMMPGEQGDILLKELSDSRPGTPVIITSGYSTVEVAFKSLTDGAFEFVPKPFTFEELSAVAARIKRFTSLSDYVKRNAYKRMSISDNSQSDIFHLGGHSWVKLLPDRSVKIGIGDLIALSVGPIVNIRLPIVGDTLTLGQYHSFLIDEEGYEYSLRTPLSGRVVDVMDASIKDGDDFFRRVTGEDSLITIVPSNLDNELGFLTRFSDEAGYQARSLN